MGHATSGHYRYTAVYNTFEKEKKRIVLLKRRENNEPLYRLLSLQNPVYTPYTLMMAPTTAASVCLNLLFVSSQKIDRPGAASSTNGLTPRRLLYHVTTLATTASAMAARSTASGNSAPTFRKAVR